MREAAPRPWRRVAAITFAFLQAGCLTGRATERGQPRYCDAALKTQLRKAAASPTAVFLQFETRSPARKMAGRKVLRLPLDEQWFQSRPANPEVASMASGSTVGASDALVREVSDWLLPPGSPIPPDAEPLPISKMGEDSARLSKRAAASRKVQVLSMSQVLEHGGDGADSGTISAKSLALADPVIAILLKREDGSTTAFIVADVHEGCEHEKGWYALAPLAVTGEAALPAQLAGHLLLSRLWME